MAIAKTAFKFKVVNHHAIKPKQFSEILSALSANLDTIKTAGAKGEKDGAKAYADAYAKAGKTIKDFVKTLSAEELGYAWKGLELTSPADKHVDDVANSVTCTWDAAAGKYMKNDAAGGDANRAKLKTRLTEFDTAIASKGATPVKKDE